jgi:hypothetical protein
MKGGMHFYRAPRYFDEGHRDAEAYYTEQSLPSSRSTPGVAASTSEERSLPKQASLPDGSRGSTRSAER